MLDRYDIFTYCKHWALILFIVLLLPASQGSVCKNMWLIFMFAHPTQLFIRSDSTNAFFLWHASNCAENINYTSLKTSKNFAITMNQIQFFSLRKWKRQQNSRESLINNCTHPYFADTDSLKESHMQSWKQVFSLVSGRLFVLPYSPFYAIVMTYSNLLFFFASLFSFIVYF